MTPFRHLVRLFGTRLLRGGPGAEAHERSTGEIVAFLVAPGLLVPFLLIPRYTSLAQISPALRDDAFWEDRLLLVVVAMLVSGAVALLAGAAVYPDGREDGLFVALPVPLATILGARLAAAGRLAVVLAVAGAAPPALLLPGVTMLPGGISGSGWIPVAHFATACCASLFTFFAVAATFGVIAALPWPRAGRKLVGVVQLLAIATLVAALLLYTGMAVLRADIARGDLSAARLLPPLWFMGMYETLLGLGGPAHRELAGLALAGTVAAVAAFAGAFGLAALRFARAPYAVEPQGRESRRRARPARVFRGPTRGLADFVRRSIARSPRHRLAFGAWCAGGLILAAVGLREGRPERGGPLAGVFAAAFVLAFCGLVGLRSVAGIPGETAADWTFHVLPEASRANARKAVRAVALGAIVLPATIVGAAVAAAFAGSRTALEHALFAGAAGWLLSELLFARRVRLPFTAVPARVPLGVTIVLGLVAFSLYAGTLPALERLLMPGGAAGAALACAAVALAVARTRDGRLPVAEAPAEEPFGRFDLA